MKFGQTQHYILSDSTSEGKQRGTDQRLRGLEQQCVGRGLRQRGSERTFSDDITVPYFDSHGDFMHLPKLIELYIKEVNFAGKKKIKQLIKEKSHVEETLE